MLLEGYLSKFKFKKIFIFNKSNVTTIWREIKHEIQEDNQFKPEVLFNRKTHSNIDIWTRK